MTQIPDTAVLDVLSRYYGIEPLTVPAGAIALARAATNAKGEPINRTAELIARHVKRTMKSASSGLGEARGEVARQVGHLVSREALAIAQQRLQEVEGGVGFLVPGMRAPLAGPTPELIKFATQVALQESELARRKQVALAAAEEARQDPSNPLRGFYSSGW